MNAVEVLLTRTPGLGWNFVLIVDGKPAPADDPEDHPTAAEAMYSAMCAMAHDLEGAPMESHA